MPARLLASVAETLASRARSGASRPSWSFGFEVMARTLRKTGLSIGRRTPLEQRAAWEQIAKAKPNPLRRQLTVTPVDAGGVPAKWVVPRGVAEDAPVLVFLHGGGYRYGSWQTHGEVVSRIITAAQVRALFVEYRLSPEHRFPAAPDDCLAATRWVLAQTPPSRVVVGGDSAGGTLTLAVLLSLRDAGDALPAGGLCLSPWVDPTERGGSLRENAKWDWAAPEEFDDWMRTYLDDADLRDPRAAPMHADLRGLPPLLLQVGSAEMLHDQVVAFARRVQAAGVDATFQVAPDMVHNWHTLAGMFPKGEPGRGIAQCAEFIRRVSPNGR